MLSIKKRNPMRKLFLYTGGAFVAGFAGIMSFLVVNNSNINEYVAQTPIQQTLPSLVNEPGSKSSNEEKSGDDNSGNNEQASTTPSTWAAPFTNTTPQSATTEQSQSSTTQPAVTTPTAPVQTTPETQPTEPVTDPVIPVEEPVIPEVPVDPEIEDDNTGLLEVILDPLF